MNWFESVKNLLMWNMMLNDGHFKMNCTSIIFFVCLATKQNFKTNFNTEHIWAQFVTPNPFTNTNHESFFFINIRIKVICYLMLDTTSIGVQFSEYLIDPNTQSKAWVSNSKCLAGRMKLKVSSRGPHKKWRKINYLKTQKIDKLAPHFL